MPFLGGDTTEVTCNHPDLGMFSFDPYAGEDSTYMYGNSVADDDDSAISASGVPIDKMSKMRDSVGVSLSGSTGDGTIESLVSLQSALTLGVWTVTNINGSVSRITGRPVGQLSGSGKDSKIELKIAGSGLQIV